MDDRDLDLPMIDLPDGHGMVVPEEAVATVAVPATPATPPTIFDDRQEQAITACGTALYTNISGTAGVGKTTVAREIVTRHPGVVLAATTGIASVNLGEGTTINALLRYFDTRSLLDAYQQGYLQMQIRKLRRSGVRRILIDEKSMLSGQQLTPIARAVREVNEGGVHALESVGVGENEDDDTPLPTREQDLPPMGITLVGDFGQLPPVPDEDPLTGRKIPLQFAFDSPEWPLFAEHTTVLERIYRQGDEDFVAALHAVRRARLKDALQVFTPERFAGVMDDTFEGTTIFAKNAEVDRYNLLRMDALHGTALVATTTRQGKPRGDWRQIPDELRLKEGALVMILANRHVSESDEDDRGTLIYANGDLGTLVGRDGSPGWLVRLHRTGATVRVLTVRRENTIPLEPGRRKELVAAGANLAEVITEQGKGKSEIIGTVTYMPLRAAYGCTVHKTQGLTLDQVQVNIRDPFFRQPGMLFVALSRARSLGGLRIVGNQTAFAERCRVEPRVLPWL